MRIPRDAEHADRRRRRRHAPRRHAAGLHAGDLHRVCAVPASRAPRWSCARAAADPLTLAEAISRGVSRPSIQRSAVATIRRLADALARDLRRSPRAGVAARRVRRARARADRSSASPASCRSPSRSASRDRRPDGARRERGRRGPVDHRGSLEPVALGVASDLLALVPLSRAYPAIPVRRLAADPASLAAAMPRLLVGGRRRRLRPGAPRVGHRSA